MRVARKRQKRLEKSAAKVEAALLDLSVKDVAPEELLLPFKP